MKKLVLSLTFWIGLISVAIGQNKTELNVGVGLIPTVVSNTSTGFPPMTASFEIYIQRNISVGAYAGLSTSKAEDLAAFLGGSEYSINYKALIIWS